MNERIKELAEQAAQAANEATNAFNDGTGAWRMVWNEVYDEKFAELIIEETLKQVDERCYGRGENQWYYDDDKKWVRLHFGYGELNKKDTVK